MPQLLAHRITPRGLIVKTAGLIADIPQGWQLCDGTNGTPDMRSRFSRGVNTNSTDPLNTGGEDQHVLTTAELPVHNHGITETAHNHTTVRYLGTSDLNTPFSTVLAKSNAAVRVLATTNAGLSSSLANTGGGLGHENRPAYYEVLFIMKVSDY